MPYGRGKGTCFGCGKKLEREGSWCHDKAKVGCRPSDWDARELHLRMNGQLEQQRQVPADDPAAVWEATLELQSLALAALPIDRTMFPRSPGFLRSRRALKWRIRSVEHGGTLTLYLDCMGHQDGPWSHPVSRGTAARWEPLLSAPEPRRRGPHPLQMADDDEGHHNYMPSVSDRLSVGFAMLEGYEDQHQMWKYLR